MDIKVISTLGLTKDDVKAIRRTGQYRESEGAYAGFSEL